MRTGGGSSPGTGGSTKAARQSSRLGHRFECFALATLPVSLSRIAYARSPTIPPSVKSAASSSSPSIDLTGNRHNARIVPTGSLEFILSPPEFGSLCAFVAELPAPEPIERLGLSLKVACVAVNGHSFSPLLRSDLPFHRCRRASRRLLLLRASERLGRGARHARNGRPTEAPLGRTHCTWVHRHDVGARQLPMGASSITVAVAMRHTRKRWPCRFG